MSLNSGPKSCTNTMCPRWTLGVNAASYLLWVDRKYVVVVAEMIKYHVMRRVTSWTMAVQYKFLSRVKVSNYIFRELGTRSVMKRRCWTYLESWIKGYWIFCQLEISTVRSLPCSLWSLMHDAHWFKDLMSRKSMIERKRLMIYYRSDLNCSWFFYTDGVDQVKGWGMGEEAISKMKKHCISTVSLNIFCIDSSLPSSLDLDCITVRYLVVALLIIHGKRCVFNYTLERGYYG